MILPPEYAWLETYLDNDSLWLDDSLNWDAAFEIAMSDYTLYTALTTPFFSNSQFFTDSVVKISFLDILFYFESNKHEQTKELYNLFLWDITSYISTKFLPAQFLFYTNFQDYVNILLHYSPELISVLTDYVNTSWVNNVFSYTPSIVFDVFSDANNAVISDFIDYFVAIFVFFFFVVIIANIFGLNKLIDSNDSYISRLFNYLFSTAKESRLQFESFLLTFFFFFLLKSYDRYIWWRRWRVNRTFWYLFFLLILYYNWILAF